MLGGGGDAADLVSNSTNHLDNRIESPASNADEFGPIFDLTLAFLHKGNRGLRPRLHILNQTLNILGSYCRLFRKLADFLGHDRKATAMFTSPRCFNRRIQGQQIGLLRNARDHLHHIVNILRFCFKLRNDIGRALRLRADRAHLGNRFFDGLATLDGRGCGIL